MVMTAATAAERRLHRRGGGPHNDQYVNSNAISGAASTNISNNKKNNSKSKHINEHSNNTTEDGGLSFPLKLHAMLEDAEGMGFVSIVSWQPGNKSFKVHDVNEFGSAIMPQYFNQTKFKSFQRQLNIYGYRRIQHGPLKGGYVHKCFVRYRPDLSSGVTRRSKNGAKAAASAVAAKVMEMVTVKGDEVRVAPDADPTQLEGVFEEFDDEPIKNIANSVDFGSCNLQGVFDRIFQADDEETSKPAPLIVASSASSAASSSAFPHQQPSPLPAAYKDLGNGHYRTASGFVMNMSQLQEGAGEEADMEALFDILAKSGGAEECDDDMMLVEDPEPPPSSESSATGGEDEEEEQLSERIFPLKLHKMLENANRDNIEHIVSWVNEGTGFKVHDSKLFTEQVMPMYFDQTKYESFRRQLNLYNFARISRGPQRGVYSHPSFLSKRRDLLCNVKRKINGEMPNVSVAAGLSAAASEFIDHYEPQAIPSSRRAAAGSAPMSMDYHNYGY